MARAPSRAIAPIAPAQPPSLEIDVIAERAASTPAVISASAPGVPLGSAATRSVTGPSDDAPSGAIAAIVAGPEGDRTNREPIANDDAGAEGPWRAPTERT